MSALEIRPEKGLASAEAARRLRTCGFNRLRRHKPKSARRIIVDQLARLMMALPASVALVTSVIPPAVGQLLKNRAGGHQN